MADKVDMSLEQLIKEKHKEAKQRLKAKKAGGGTPAKSPAAKIGKAKKGNGKQNNGGQAQANGNQNKKIAQAVGAGKAKRAALTNQRRGLNATGQATKMDIDKAVAAQANKQGGAGRKNNNNRRRPNSAGSNSTGTRPAPVGGAPKTGLQISFKPSELNATTDKLVAQQIRGVLAKQGGGGGGLKQGGNKPAAQAGRSVMVRK